MGPGLAQGCASRQPTSLGSLSHFSTNSELDQMVSGLSIRAPVRLPREDGRLDEWNRSALEAADMARERWVRVAANMSLGAYEVYEAAGSIPDPDWPDVTFRALLEIAFKGRFIQNLDHPVIHRLRGET